jgi:hypothetical protein
MLHWQHRPSCCWDLAPAGQSPPQLSNPESSRLPM